jgi:DNA-binding IclR family transcriptional regulator
LSESRGCPSFKASEGEAVVSYVQLQKLSESSLAVLYCFKSSPEKRLKVSDIEKDTSIPRRSVQYALQTLTKKGFIQKLGQKSGTRYQLIF